MKFKMLAAVIAAALVSSAYAFAIARSYQAPVPVSAAIAGKSATPSGKTFAAGGDKVVHTASAKQDRLVLKNAAPQFEQAAPTELMVQGIATGDLLNIRLNPSPAARIVARLDNGAVVNKLGCQEVSGHRWCMVELLDGRREKGWAAARYLIGPGEEPGENQL